MTKADIIDEIVSSTGVARKDVTATVEAFMEAIKGSLLDKKENVYLRGFGSFIVKHRAEKTARNISKNTTIVIAAHDFPSFKPAKSFVSKMKGEEDEEYYKCKVVKLFNSEKYPDLPLRKVLYTGFNDGRSDEI